MMTNYHPYFFMKSLSEHLTTSINLNMMKIMFMYMLFFIILLSIIKKSLNSMIMMMKLIIFTSFNILLSYMNFNNSIYMYMIFISIIGSVMIMFLYFVSLINNEPNFKIKKPKYLSLWANVILIFISISLLYYLNFNQFEFLPLKCFYENNMFMYKIYLTPLTLTTTLLIIYLFYILILIMKMCSNKYMALRKMKN